MSISSPKLQDMSHVAPRKGFDAMGIPILRAVPDDYPTLVPDNPWRTALDERQWVHVHWNPMILADIVNHMGKITGQATYSGVGVGADGEKPWPKDVQYMGTWMDPCVDEIVQRYCHPSFPKVQEGAVIPVARIILGNG